MNKTKLCASESISFVVPLTLMSELFGVYYESEG